MASIPRDLAGVPLGDGTTYAAEDQLPDELSPSATRSIQGRRGAGRWRRRSRRCSVIPIHALRDVDLDGFVTMVDAVGGVDIT